MKARWMTPKHMIWLVILALVFFRLYGEDLYQKILKPEASSTFGLEQGLNDLLVGFVLYVDLETDLCSACFSKINELEKVKARVSDLKYAVVIRDSDFDEGYYSAWIKEHINPNFNQRVWIDKEGYIPERYGVGPGSKNFLFGPQGALISIAPVTEGFSTYEYAAFFNE